MGHTTRFSLLFLAAIVLVGKTHGLASDPNLYEIAKTSNAYHYDDYCIDLSQRTSMIVKIKACNDGHIALSANTDDFNSQTYEIVIGGWGNTKSVIRRSQQGAAEDTDATADRLSCSGMRPFWVSWDSGIIKVGSGTTVYSNEFLSYNDPTPYPVRSASFSTGWGATGDFEYNLALVNECCDSPCDNGGTCVDNLGSYTCNCIYGYIGTDCETACTVDVGPCDATNCGVGKREETLNCGGNIQSPKRFPCCLTPCLGKPGGGGAGTHTPPYCKDLSPYKDIPLVSKY